MATQECRVRLEKTFDFSVSLFLFLLRIFYARALLNHVNVSLSCCKLSIAIFSTVTLYKRGETKYQVRYERDVVLKFLVLE